MRVPSPCQAPPELSPRSTSRAEVDRNRVGAAPSRSPARCRRGRCGQRRRDRIPTLWPMCTSFQGFGVLVENRDVADYLEARIGKLDEESGIPLMTRRVWISHRHHEGQLRDAGSGGEPLLAVENPVGAVAHRSRLHARGIGASGLLRHREADPDVAVDERDEVTLLLLLGAVFDQCQHRRVLRPHAVQRPRAEVRERPADLDLDDRVLEVAQPHPAVLDGHERTPQTFRACLRLHVGDDAEERPSPDLGFGRQHDGVDEVGDPCSWPTTSCGSSKSTICQTLTSLTVHVNGAYSDLVTATDDIALDDAPLDAWIGGRLPGVGKPLSAVRMGEAPASPSVVHH